MVNLLEWLVQAIATGIIIVMYIQKCRNKERAARDMFLSARAAEESGDIVLAMRRYEAANRMSK